MNDGPTLIVPNPYYICGDCRHKGQELSDWKDVINCCQHPTIVSKHPESRQLLNYNTPRWCPANTKKE